MNTETIYTITAACTLIAAGITSFPYRLSYGNTSWLPWWMQPDSRYLERPYEYDYPARNINLLFSVSVMAIGILAMLFILTPELPDNVPAERWFAALAVLYPAYASCQVLFWRKDYSLPCLCLLPGTFLAEGLRRRLLLCRQDFVIQLWKGIYDSSGSCNHICPLPDKCGDIICLSWGEYGILSALLSVPHT